MYPLSVTGPVNKHAMVKIALGLSILGFIFTLAINKNFVSHNVERSCMNVLEKAAWTARLEAPEKHAKVIFDAMATTECQKLQNTYKIQ